MAIDLLNSFLQKGNQISSGNKPASRGVQEQPVSLQAQQILRGIRMLQAGQTLQGEILSVKGDQVQLEILKEVMIEAKLAGALSLTPGTNMIFQVKGNQNGALSLMPLFTNTSTDPNVLKALDMAGISVNDRTTQMVQTMMEKGMSVNKQSLLEMYRDVVANKDSAVNDIVSLKHMGIEVTEDSLKQYSMYKENTHFLTKGFEDIGKALGKQLEQWMAEGKTENAVHLLKDLDAVFHQTQSGSQFSQTAEQQVTSSSSPLIFVSEEGLPEIQNKEILNPEIAPENEVISEGEESNTAVQKEEIFSAKNGDLQKMGAEFNQPETMEELWNVVSTRHVSKKISDIFFGIWKKNIQNEWMMKPEEVFDQKSVEQLYKKMEEQIKQLEHVVEDSVSNQSAAGKVIHQTSSNLEFMNQLNQIHTYIQLPLKMTNQNTTGELYVFTNKKSVAEKDGKVTALLHLDMEYLGKMDIHVAMENKKVATNFYLEKEEILDFLEDHMELLSDRLQKRGYDCKIKTNLRKEEEEESFIEKMEKNGSGQILLSTQAFDMRA